MLNTFSLINKVRPVFSCCVIIIMLSLCFGFTGCSGLKGEFGFKTFKEDVYKKFKENPEFNKNQEIQWVYSFKKVTEPHQVGVTLLKKELVWVEINSRAENINKTNTIIYGKIFGFDEGLYKLEITESGKLIEEKEFSVYSDEEDYYN